MNLKLQILLSDQRSTLLDLLGTKCAKMGLEVTTYSDVVSALADVDCTPPHVVLMNAEPVGQRRLSACEMYLMDPRLKSTTLILVADHPHPQLQRLCRERGAHFVREDKHIWSRIKHVLAETLLHLQNDHQESSDNKLTMQKAAHSEPRPRSPSESGDIVDAIFAELRWLSEQVVPQQFHPSLPPENPWLLTLENDAKLVAEIRRSVASIGVRLERGFQGMSCYDDRATIANRGLPVAIILDETLPGRDSQSILRQLRRMKETKRVPVFVYASTDDLERKRLFLDSGAKAFLQKPARWESLAAVLRRHTSLRIPRVFRPARRRADTVSVS